MRAQTSVDRLRDIHVDLQKGIRELTTSDDWKRALAFASRFHSYSFGNVLRIHMQCPSATYVAGFRKWQDLGRHVRRGERGIAILAPIVAPRRHAESDDVDDESVIRSFKLAYVFDVAQTDGADLPRTVFADRIVGGGNSERQLFDRLADAMRAH